jgi:hypothetical protein
MSLRKLTFYVAVLVAAAGCSALPGLRVLTGEEAAPSDIAQVVEESDLVMADKTGSTDPSLMAAANRIEAATGTVDMIEIRKDEANDTFVMNMLFSPPSDANGQTQEGLISYYTALQRALELSWQGTLVESEGTGILAVTFIYPIQVATLTGTEPNFIGHMDLNAQIERSDAIAYLSGSRTLSDFLDLIANGTLSFQQAEQFTPYEGQPNHPLFMLQPTAAQETSTEGESSSTNSGQ